MPPHLLPEGGGTLPRPTPPHSTLPPSSSHTHKQEHDDKRMAEVFTSLLMETASIFSASAILSLGGVATAPGVPPDHRAIWVNAVVQVGQGGAGCIGATGSRGDWPVAVAHALGGSAAAQRCPPASAALRSAPALRCRAHCLPPAPRPQLATTLVFGFLGLALEGKYHAFE